MSAVGNVCVSVARDNNSLRRQGALRVVAPLQLAATARPIGSAHARIPRRTDRRTDITTGLHIVSFAFTGGLRKQNIYTGLDCAVGTTDRFLSSVSPFM